MQKTEFKTLWLDPPDVLTIKTHQVDVWRIPLDLSPDIVKLLESTLSTDEARRAGRFHFPKDRKCYIVAHGVLRQILSCYLACEPSQINFSKNGYGKPLLDGHELEFNLSHSGNFALVAVSRKGKVGVDVERIRSDIELENMARRFFSPNEVADLMSLPLEQRSIAFFNCWTRKEAYIKAQGLGLSMPLEDFDVSLAPNKPALLRTTRLDAQETTRWTLFALDVHPGYTAALAVEGRGLLLKLWYWKMVIQ